MYKSTLNYPVFGDLLLFILYTSEIKRPNRETRKKSNHQNLQRN